MSKRKRTVRIVAIKDDITKRMHEMRKELGKSKPTARERAERLFNLQTV